MTSQNYFSPEWWAGAAIDFGREIITGVIGAGIAGLIGWYFYRRGELTRAKQEFAAVVAPIRERVELAQDPSAVRADTLQDLAGPHHQFRFRLGGRHRKKLEQAWQQYRDLPKSDLGPRLFESTPQDPLKAPADPYAQPRQKILRLLDKLLEFTK